MERQPNRDINLEERTKAISLILKQQMVLNKTLQLEDIKELYEELSLKDSATLVAQANRNAYVLEGLDPHHSSALTLRLTEIHIGTNPFFESDTPNKK
jgi:hypothetical protein